MTCMHILVQEGGDTRDDKHIVPVSVITIAWPRRIIKWMREGFSKTIEKFHCKTIFYFTFTFWGDHKCSKSFLDPNLHTCMYLSIGRGRCLQYEKQKSAG